MKIEYINGHKSLRFGNFMVQERKEGFYGIYLIQDEQILTHTRTWKQATKKLHC